MRELIFRLLGFLVIGNCCLNGAATADGSFSEPLSVHKNFGQLNGAHLTFVVAHSPPVLNVLIGPDGNHSLTGVSALFIDWLAAKLNFTYTYIYIPNNMTKAKYGKMSDFAVVFNLVAHKEVDGSAVPAIMTPDRKKIGDFAYFVFSEPHAIVVPRQGEEPRLFAFIRPFQKSVWLLIFISMLVVVFLLTFLKVIHSRFLSNESSETRSRELSLSIYWKTASDYGIYVINTMTNQGGNVPGSRFSLRILLGVWLLAATVLVNSYSGTVVSYLTAPKMIPSINTLEDLAASKDVGVLVVDNNLMGQQILDAQSGTLKILGDQVRRNPDQVVNNVLNASTLLETGRYALPYVQSFCNDFVARNFKKDGNCRFKTTDPITSSAFWNLPLQKNSKFTSDFYLAQMRAWEMGLPQYWMKTTTKQAPECSTKKRPAAAQKRPIRINDLTGAFLIFGIGMGLATLPFLMEKIVYFHGRNMWAN